MSLGINCNAKQTYSADLTVPVAATGVLAAPALGAVTSIKLRFSLTKNGAAIHVDVGTLAVSERSGKPGRFYYELSQLLHQTHLLTLGEGTPYFAIYSRANEFDIESFEYHVLTGTYQ